MRFELIDRVIESDEQHLIAVKCVTCAEEYLADHFPGFPVLPGVLMLESLVQAGRRLLASRSDAAPGRWVLGEVRNVRYGNMVRPGQSLHVEVRVRKQTESGFELEATGRVDGDDIAVQGRIRLVPLRTYES